MAKASSQQVYVCQNCGAVYSKWMGRCSSCGEWNSLTEEKQLQTKSRLKSRSEKRKVTTYRLSEIEG
ncbi:MAG: DNA repair protein RadA, partial [candidate division Zixibacteria bacterium]|nr:DNA repair protein RadA [candidate division Zixibacteria bacterium]